MLGCDGDETVWTLSFFYVVLKRKFRSGRIVEALFFRASSAFAVKCVCGVSVVCLWRVCVFVAIT